MMILLWDLDNRGRHLTEYTEALMTFSTFFNISPDPNTYHVLVY